MLNNEMVTRWHRICMAVYVDGCFTAFVISAKIEKLGACTLRYALQH